MKRFSSIDNINRKYRNSQIAARTSVVGGYGSSYVPPQPSVVLGTNPVHNVGITNVRPAVGFKSSYVGRTSVPAGFPQGAQVVRLQESPQVVYRQSQSPTTRIVHEQHPIPTQVARPLPPVSTPISVSSPAPLPTTTITRQTQARAPNRRSFVSAKNNSCPWWCWLICGILGLLLLLGFLGGLWAYFNREKIGKVLSQTKNQNLNKEQSKTLTKNNLKNETTGTVSTNTTTPTGKQETKQQVNTGSQENKGEAVEENKGGEAVEENKGGEAVEENKGGEAVEENKGGEAVEENKGEAVEENKGGEGGSSSSNAYKTQSQSSTKVTKLTCQNGFFFYQGRCLACPQGATWNGTNCVRSKRSTTTVTQTVNGESNNSGTETKQDNKQNETSQNSQDSQNTTESGSNQANSSESAGSSSSAGSSQSTNQSSNSQQGSEESKATSAEGQSSTSTSDATSSHHLRSIIH